MCEWGGGGGGYKERGGREGCDVGVEAGRKREQTNKLKSGSTRCTVVAQREAVSIDLRRSKENRMEGRREGGVNKVKLSKVKQINGRSKRSSGILFFGAKTLHSILQGPEASIQKNFLQTIFL